MTATNEMDALYFSTFEQVKNDQFDFIVIGAGAYGSSFAHRLLQLDSKAKILIVEKGNYLIPDHIQNIPPTYIKLNTTTGIRPWIYTGTPNLNFMICRLPLPLSNGRMPRILPRRSLTKNLPIFKAEKQAPQFWCLGSMFILKIASRIY